VLPVAAPNALASVPSAMLAPSAMLLEKPESSVTYTVFWDSFFHRLGAYDHEHVFLTRCG
jgi:hypothetical protein